MPMAGRRRNERGVCVSELTIVKREPNAELYTLCNDGRGCAPACLIVCALVCWWCEEKLVGVLPLRGIIRRGGSKCIILPLK